MRAIPTGKYQINKGHRYWWLAEPDGYLWWFMTFRDAVMAMQVHARCAARSTP